MITVGIKCFGFTGLALYVNRNRTITMSVSATYHTNNSQKTNENNIELIFRLSFSPHNCSLQHERINQTPMMTMINRQSLSLHRLMALPRLAKSSKNINSSAVSCNTVAGRPDSKFFTRHYLKTNNDNKPSKLHHILWKMQTF